MKLLRKIVFAAVLAFPAALLAGPGGPGHDHDEAKAVQAGPATPRVEARSELFELVAIFEGGKLTLYLDRFATNEPVTNAAIEIESGAFKAAAQPGGDGTYTAAAAALAKPGQYPLVFTIREAGEIDLLNAMLGVPPPPSTASHAQDLIAWLAWIVGVVVVLAVLGWWVLRRRRPPRAPVVAVIAASVMLVLLEFATSAHAHEGEDHSADKKGAAAPVPVGARGNAAAQRFADGGVFMPKPAQRQLGIRTALAEIRELAQSIEFNGRIVADPNAGGRVQSSQPGRIEPGPRGLPTLGQKVSRGEVLAYVKPVANAIELGNQRAQLVELTAQHELTEKRLKRLAALEGSVPQKEIDTARAELASFADRKAAVSASLFNRETLSAPVSGVISAASAVAGQVVEAREVLYEIVDPQRLMVEALAYDPMVLADIGAANAVLPGNAALVLVFVGGAQQLREQALPLLFRIKPPLPPLAVGQPLKVVAQTKRTLKGVAVPLAALTRTSVGDTVLWVHAGAETFVPRKVRHQALDGASAAVTEGVAAGERVVTQGASALAQVR